MNSKEYKYRAIDLFAGAGGLSLGFESEGFSIPLAIEKDTWAKNTYNLNHIDKNCIEADITTLPDDFFQKYNGNVDVVMGGPPCQGFSIAASNRRKEFDERNFLYRQFLRVVKLVAPKMVLIENVKEFIKYHLPNGELLIKDIVETLENLGYVCSYSVFELKDYGIPQDRKRTFLMAAKIDLVQTLDLHELLKPFLKSPITLGEAISDLPQVEPYQYKEGDVLEYTKQPQNEFQMQLRNKCDKVYNHIPMQHTAKTVEKFKFIMAHSKEEMPDDLKSRVRGNVNEISKSAFSQNHRVMDANKISPTITASFYSSFIHPNQPRNLTVREAARVQTFPDTFIFTGKKTTLSKKLLSKKGIIEDLHLDQFNQVGNAVPPMMAGILAKICKTILGTKV
ncbi:DNA cytosine methyltransferase [Segatella copri]|uniref:DNA cytosine methyltransferase n=1 Tax=Segatella copri TaxID=165179 RepID=UPI003F973AF5